MVYFKVFVFGFGLFMELGLVYCLRIFFLAEQVSFLGRGVLSVYLAISTSEQIVTSQYL